MQGWNFWIGFNCNLNPNVFTWSDETDVDFTNWNGDEPNGYVSKGFLNGNKMINIQGYDQCVEMYSTREKAGKWNDQPCTELRSYICEIKADIQYPEPVRLGQKSNNLKICIIFRLHPGQSVMTLSWLKRVL